MSKSHDKSKIHSIRHYEIEVEVKSRDASAAADSVIKNLLKEGEPLGLLLAGLLLLSGTAGASEPEMYTHERAIAGHGQLVVDRTQELDQPAHQSHHPCIRNRARRSAAVFRPTSVHAVHFTVSWCQQSASS